MAWGEMSSLGKTRLAFLEGNQDAFDYQQTLTTHLFEFVDGVHEGDYVFQHDNTSIHRVHAMKDFLADLSIPTIDWLALSPDLNPIENLWGIVAYRAYKNARQYSSVGKLKTAILGVWDEISVDLLAKLASSVFDRCHAVVRSKGNKIAY
jgi:hypothetical protein